VFEAAVPSLLVATKKNHSESHGSQCMALYSDIVPRIQFLRFS
jgi:hypothetical protein